MHGRALALALALTVALAAGAIAVQVPAGPRRPTKHIAAQPSRPAPKPAASGPFRFPRPTQGPRRPAAVAPPGAPGAPRSAAAVLPSPLAPPVNRLIYGVNVVWGDSGGGANWDKQNGAKASRLAKLMKSAGVTNTRIGIGWADVERVRGHYDWNATDRFVRFVSKLGVVPICVVAVTPDWALDHSPATLRLFSSRSVANLAGVRAPEPAYYGDLTRFAAACAQRYKGAIKHWEFWNEPDGMGMPVVVRDASGRPVDIRYGGDPKVYVRLLKAFATGVRRADPAARIAVGGLQVPRTDFLSAIYANGGRPYFNAVALHPYNNRGVIAFGWIDRCRALVVSKGDAAKPFWLTEWGWATTPGQKDGVTEAHQAKLIRESLAGMRARPYITQASYHTLNDWRTNEGDPRTLIAMGLCGYSLQPKPAYTAFREAATGRPAILARPASSVPLLAPLPPTDSGGVRPATIGVTVDAAHPGDPVPALWAGFTQGPGIDPQAFASSIAPKLAPIGAKLVRLDPFPRPDMVGLMPADAQHSTPADRLRVDWTYADALVRAIEGHGAKPVLSFGTVPTALAAAAGGPSRIGSPDAWAELLRQAARRYGPSPGVAYWELSIDTGAGEGSREAFRDAYALFARTIRAASPTARVGGPAGAGFDRQAIETFARDCAAAGVPLDYVSWRAVGASPAEVARQVRDVRAFLQTLPPLRGTEVFVDEWGLSARADAGNGGLAGAFYALALESELMEAGPVRTLCYELSDGPAGARWARTGGGWGIVTGDGKPKPIYAALHLLSRLEGRRMRATSDETGVRVLAGGDGKRVSALVWREVAADAKHAEPDLPVMVRFRNPPWAGQSRGELRVLDHDHGAVAPPDSPTGLGPVARFDAAPGDITVPVVLAQGRAAVVEIAPAQQAPVTVSLTSPRYVVYGGTAVPVTAVVRSALSRPTKVELSWSCSDSGAVPGSESRTQRVALAPGGSATTTLWVRPVVRAATSQEFVQVVAASDAGGPVAYGSIAVKAASPLQAVLVPARAMVVSPGPPRGIQSGAAGLRISAFNQSDQPLPVTFACGATRTHADLKPHQGSMLTLQVPAPSTDPGNYPVKVDALLADRTLATIEGEIGVPIVCVHAARKPRIDADLSEWQSASSIGLDRPDQVKDKRWGGRSDLSGRVMVMWDEQNLYVAAAVADDTFYQPYTADQMWMGDSLQFAVDTRPTPGSQEQGYGPDDAEFGIARVSGSAAVYRFAGARGPGLVRAAHAAVRRIEDRTIYEAAIPWSEIGSVRPFAGGLMGLSVLLNDNDGSGRGYMEWAGGIADAKQPGKFIGMRFVR